eukprot:scaffold50612_cov17-Tisochrysis_lutea.AAC.1
MFEVRHLGVWQPHFGKHHNVWRVARVQVSNIRRAVNDKSTKDMMPPALRQRLLNEGRPGALAFVATQTDVLVSLPHFEYLERQPLPTAIKGEVLGHHV